MADALVSAVTEQLVSIISQQAEDRIGLIVGADKEVEKLSSNFRAIQAVLEDAETRQVKEKAVRDWLEKLKGVCYDIDDVLDEWKTSFLKLQIEQVENASKPLRKVCSVVSYYLRCCRRVIFRYDIAAKIEELNKSLDVISIEKSRFNLSLTEGTQKLEQPMTTSLIDIQETSISYMPKGVERLTALLRLGDFVVDNGGDGSKTCKLDSLKNFKQLKSIAIKGWGDLVDLGDIKRANLNQKINLLELDLNFDGMMNVDHEVILEAVLPPAHLEILKIEQHRGKTIFPGWSNNSEILKSPLLFEYLHER
ncbi:NB-ARC domain-containing disease resistance protein [Melia azedarach]|uniref:NB-ARC domain-containing disease resistance protein n=1 Tax=Melia azedarach TaxID=155640 RepID=A0ACC1Y2L6_MELAZ|nr:NB-ARC domain-containing disease resistance protein [Melia azedarach]